jgi:hypothetical protein
MPSSVSVPGDAPCNDALPLNDTLGKYGVPFDTVFEERDAIRHDASIGSKIHTRDPDE